MNNKDKEEQVYKFDHEVHINKKTNKITREFYYHAGTKELGRIGGPAFIINDPDTGQLLKEAYHFQGFYHRPPEEGPASRKWDSAGNLVLEAYIEHGTLSRENGPARTKYDPQSGEIIQQFCKNGRNLRTVRTNKSNPAQDFDDFSP